MNHAVPGEPVAGGGDGPLTALAYSAAEWRLLTWLPGRVIVMATPIVTATPMGPGRPDCGLLAGLAGLDGIAAGRMFDSDLVRAVVAAIYAESDGGPASGRAAEPHGGVVDLFADCRAVTRLLAERADPADSAVYRHWVQSVAARVVSAAARDADGAARPDGPAPSPAQRHFLAELGRVLGLAGAD